MTKSELRTGMILERRNDKRALVLRDTVQGDVIVGSGTWCPLSAYTEDLKYPGFPWVDIVKIRLPENNMQFCEDHWSQAPVIWTRPVVPPEREIEIKGKKYSESTIHAALKAYNSI